jgi:hypothetical protein
MSVKPELAFDVCWDLYKNAKGVREAKRAISALKVSDAASKFSWRPDIRPRLNEWVADFALAGKAALEGPDWASRMVLFRVYLPGTRALRQGAAFRRPEREKLGELDRRGPASLRRRAAAPGYVPAAKMLHYGSVVDSVVCGPETADCWRMSGSPTRSVLPHSEGGTLVFVDRR